MSEIKDALRAVVQNLIKDDEAAAQAAFHPALTSKMREVSGLGRQSEPTNFEHEDLSTDGINHDDIDEDAINRNAR